MIKKTLRWMPVTMVLLAACNLGPGVPGGEVTPTVEFLIPVASPIPEGQVLPPPTSVFQTGAQGAGAQPATIGETFGPVTITGDLIVQAPITVRVKRGDAVSSVNCLFIHQETNATSVLPAPTTSGPSLDGTFDEVFTFTPSQGGTYSISCTGVALTLDGLHEVDTTSAPFAVEAKG